LRGAHFGEMALVDRSPRSASATAEDRTRVLCLRRSDFYDILRKEAPLSVKLLWSFVQVLTQRLRKTTAELSVTRVEHSSGEAPDGIDEVVNFE
jgi:CRP-like cAMP-binding protein